MKFRMAMAALLTASMGVFGVGCSPAATPKDQQRQAQWVGNFFAFLIIGGLCQYTTFCPIPGDPVGSPPAP